MRRIILPIVFLFISFPLFAQKDTTRVLFIGNSFTYVSDVPGLVKGLADKAGLNFEFTMHAPGGISVGDKDQDTFAHMYNPTVFRLISSGNWDYVVLQDNQGRFIYGDKKFPDTSKSRVIEGHFKIRDSVKQYNSCAHMVWFAGWAFKYGYPGIGATGAELIDNIYENYSYLKDTAGEIVAPIGIAWERAMATLPATDLWSPDSAHQSLAGSYLTASVLFSSIFRMDPQEIPFNGGLDSMTARTLRTIGYQKVTDSMASNNLATFTPELTITENMLTAAPGYTSYKWLKNDSVIGTTTVNTFAVAASGCYQVMVTGSDLCEARSLEKCITVLAASHIANDNGIKIYPVPAGNVINVDNVMNVGNLTGYKLSVVNMMGNVVKELNINSNHVAISTADMPVGNYFINITMGSNSLHYKVQVVR
ncbi:MAG: C-terminal target protein [Flavipsychrobacter sp.]|nr:C-terminal target protein [Flavipsychrobacter sp.]